MTTVTAASAGSHLVNRHRTARIVALAVNSGATDAIGFLALGGAFTSVMTGNMILLGLSVNNPSLAVRTVAAIISYIAGASVGARVAGQAAPSDPPWPREVTRALVVEWAIFVAYAIGWYAAGSRPSASLQLGLLMLNATALGVQSAAIQRFGIAGLSTTYLTGTLTTVVARLAQRRPVREVVTSLQILGGLIAGAATGGALVRFAPPIVPVVQLSSLGCVIASVTWPTSELSARIDGRGAFRPDAESATAKESTSSGG